MFLLPEEYWEIRTTPDRGRGVFARRAIEPGTVIGDYLGKIISNDEEEIYGEKYGYYARHHTDHSLIFPDPPDVPGVHLLNHSCAPSCDLMEVEGHSIHYAARRIFPGEELTVDYSMDPRETECAVSEIACRCGSPFCRGTMCTAPALHDALAPDEEEEEEEDAGEEIPLGSELPPLKKYPKTMADDPRTDLYGCPDRPPLECDDDRLPPVREIRKRIRNSGCMLRFPQLGLRVVGVFRSAAVVRPGR